MKYLFPALKELTLTIATTLITLPIFFVMILVASLYSPHDE